MNLLDGVAVVTGGGSGIGKDCVLAYAAEGVRGVAVIDIDGAAAQAVAEESKRLATNFSFEAVAIATDVSDERSVEAMVGRVVGTFGRIDYLVNSAGVGVEAPLEVSEASVSELDRFYRVNLRGSFLCLREVTKVMLKQENRTITAGLRPGSAPRQIGRGVIINLGSCNSVMATPKLTPYTTAKHAILGLTRNAALDNAKYGIRVVAVCPSWVDTPMIDRAKLGDAGLQARIEKTVPLGRIATQQEVSDVIVFLSSYRASYITGTTYIIDGGATLSTAVDV